MPFHGAIARPRTTILAGVAAVLLAGSGIGRLEIRTDGHSLVPAGSPQVQRDTRVRDEYGIEDQIVMVVTAGGPGGVFNTATLELVGELTTQAAALPGAGEVTSLATERGARVRPGTLEFRTLLDPLPADDRQLQRLRDDLDALELYTGTLVSRDGRSAAILVGVKPGADRVALYRQVRDLAAGAAGDDNAIRITGAPVAESLLGAHILDDLGVPAALTGYPSSRPPLGIGLVPVAIAVMTLIFLVTFRSIPATLLPLCEVAACLLFVLGLMGWCGVPITLPTTVMPVILTAIGVADEIHIFLRYRSIAAASGDGAATVTRTMTEMWRPVTRTSITTAIAFLSFAISPIDAVRSFGIFTAVGVLFCMAWSLTVIPAALVLTPRGSMLPWGRRAGAPVTPAAGRLAARLARAIVRRRLAVVAAAAALLLAAVPATRLLRIQDSWIDGFAPRSEFRRATEAFNRDFLGMHVLLVTIDGDADTLLSPDVLRDVCDLGAFIGAHAGQAVGGVLGPCEFLATTAFILGGQRPAARRVPDKPQDIRSTWSHYERVRGTRRLREVIDADYSRTVLAVYMKDANFAGTRQLMDDIETYAAGHLAADGLAVGFAGDVAVSQTLIDAIVSTQLRSLLLSLAGILLVAALLGRSLWWGVCCVLPCAVAVVIVFAVMGLAGIPLGVATSMFAGMTLGIGVDYAIHFMERYRLAVSAGAGGADAIADALGVTGPAVTLDALAVAAGFGVLVLSRVPANARLGGLIVLAVAACFAATLVLLPALVSLRPPAGSAGGGRPVAS